MSLLIELKISDNDTHIEVEIEVLPETNQATLVRKNGEFGYEILFQRTKPLFTGNISGVWIHHTPLGENMQEKEVNNGFTVLSM